MSLKIGMVGTDNGHAAILAGCVNGWAESAPTPLRAGGYVDPFYHFWQYQRTELALMSGQPTPFGSTRVASIWGSNVEATASIASACSIPHVASSIEELCDNVDAVMVLSGDPDLQPGQAAPSLRRGMPTFIDKPMAATVAACREVYAQANRHGAKLFSGSGLRWSVELHNALREFTDGYQEKIEGLYIKVPNVMAQYGIHAVEIANVFLGADVRSVGGTSAGNRSVLLLEYGTGQSAVIETLYAQVRPSYCINIYGERHTKMIHMYDTALPFFGLLGAFIEMAEDGVVPVAEKEVLRLMEITLAAQSVSAGEGPMTLTPYE